MTVFQIPLLIWLILIASNQILYAKPSLQSNFKINKDLWEIDDPRIHLKAYRFATSPTEPTAVQLRELSETTSVPFNEDNFGLFNILTLQIENTSDRSQTSYFSHFAKTHSQFYHLHDESLAQIKRMTHRLDIAKIQLKPGMNTLFLVFHNKIKNFGPNFFGFQIFDEKKFLQSAEINAYLFGSAFGIAFMLLLFSFVSFVTLKKKYFLYYSLYGLSAAYMFLVVVGFVAMNADHLYLTATLHTLFAMLFIENVLNIRKNSTVLIYIMYIILAIIVVFGSYTYFSLKDPFLFLSLGSLPVTYMSLASYIRYKQGYKPAVLFLMGFLFFWFGATIAVIDNLYFSNTTRGLPALICWVIELGFFKIATDVVVKRSEEEAITHSDHAFKQLAKVVYSHQIEQIKKGDTIESTMPIHKSEACVISFDIVGSSKIDHLKAKVFLRNLFRRCNEAMIENYDPDTLTSNAFRIKEMGDGFLCSVGYPFISPSDNFANDAINLSLRFQRILQDEEKILESETPICCSIGIAFDELQGFYPEGGTKEYDIFGRAIILATRYERLRKIIRPSDCDQSIIICQRRVIESASPRIRKSFNKIDLSKKNISVRNDTHAKDIFVKFLDHKSASLEIDPPTSDLESYFDAVS